MKVEEMYGGEKNWEKL